MDFSQQDKPSAKRQKLIRHEGVQWSEGDDADIYADWTLVVESTTRKRTFAVHRMVLGPKSEYFEAMFKNSFSEKAERCTKLSLHQILVDHFHVFLDFCYTGESLIDSDMTHSPAEKAAVLSLLDYFGMKQRYDVWKDYVKKSMTESADLVEYYKISKQISFGNLEALVVEACAAKSSHLDDDGELYKAIDADFLLQVLRTAKVEGKTASRIWSDIASKYCKANHTGIDLDMFLHLTDSAVLPYFGDNAAEIFLNLQWQYEKLGQKLSRNKDDMTSIERRCRAPLYRTAFCSKNDDRAGFLKWIMETAPALSKAIIHCAARQVKTPFTPCDPRYESSSITQSNNRRIYPQRAPLDPKTCSFRLNMHMGKAVVTKCSHAQPQPGDVLLSVEGVVIEACDTQTQLKAQILAAAPAGAVFVDMLFMHDPEYQKLFEQELFPERDAAKNRKPN